MDETRITEELKKLSGVTLADASRTRMRTELGEYARINAAPVAQHVTWTTMLGQWSGAVSGRVMYIHRVFGRQLSYVLASLLIVVLIGAGTSLAAQGSVPGDLLYPIKVNFNEHVQGVLAVSDASKATLDAHLATERLKEAQTLEASGRLTPTTSAELTNRIVTHYKEANDHSERAQASGDASTSATVHASLDGTLHSYASVLSNADKQEHSSAREPQVKEIQGYITRDEHANEHASFKSTSTATVKARGSDNEHGNGGNTTVNAGNSVGSATNTQFKIQGVGGEDGEGEHEVEHEDEGGFESVLGTSTTRADLQKHGRHEDD